MKKLILLSAIALCISLGSYAQNTAKYCHCIIYRNFMKNYVAEVQTEGKRDRQKSLLKDAQGNKMKFTSEIDALNYIVKQGWEPVSAYSSHGETNYILKK